MAARRASRNRSSVMGAPSSREGARVGRGLEQLRAGLGALLGEGDRVGDLRLDVAIEAVERGAVAGLLEPRPGPEDRVLLLPLLELVLRPVLARIAHRVAAEAVRPELHERWLTVGARALDGLAEAVLHLEDVV